MTVGPSLAPFLEALAHYQNVASLSFFYRYYFGRCSSELDQLVPLPFTCGKSTRYFERLHDFSVTIPRCYKIFWCHDKSDDLFEKASCITKSDLGLNWFFIIFVNGPMLGLDIKD